MYSTDLTQEACGLDHADSAALGRQHAELDRTNQGPIYTSSLKDLDHQGGNDLSDLWMICARCPYF